MLCSLPIDHQIGSWSQPSARSAAATAAMMSPLEDLDVSPTHVELDRNAPACAETAREREMVFYQRPGIAGRQLLLQPRRAGVDVEKSDLLAGPPVQLLAMDGTTYLGVSATAASHTRSRNRSESAGAGRDGGAGNTSSAASQDGLARVRTMYHALCCSATRWSVSDCLSVASRDNEPGLRQPEQAPDPPPAGSTDRLEPPPMSRVV